MVSNNKSFSVGVQSPTEINAPRGCAVILRRICQLSLTRITHQVSRAFDLKTLAAEKRRYSEADCECPMSALLDDRKIVISFIWTLKKREQFGGVNCFFFEKF